MLTIVVAVLEFMNVVRHSDCENFEVNQELRVKIERAVLRTLQSRRECQLCASFMVDENK